MILHGDCLDELKKLPDNSVDLIATDPPYGYSFMGKAWDKALPDAKIWKECLRVLKDGAFAFVMSAPRSDVCSRMMLDLEDAGFRIDFTPIYWTYASGFPKAMNIGKAVDKRNGHADERPRFNVAGQGIALNPDKTKRSDHPNYVKPAAISDAAKALDGSYGGFQPKPAVEVIIVAMKPLSEKTFVDQALKNGKGITWLDDCRVPAAESTGRPSGYLAYEGGAGERGLETAGHAAGRFPANLLVEDNVLDDHSRYFSLDSWADTLPFLAVPKASKREKNEGLGDNFKEKLNHDEDWDGMGSRTQPMKNFHPTVKPIKLMSYLITLGSRAGDVVLDPFLGSGTTAVAAKMLGRNPIGIEREAEYVAIAKARLEATKPETKTLPLVA